MVDPLYSGVLGGSNSNVTHLSSFAIGSNLTSTLPNTLFTTTVSATSAIFGDGTSLTNIVLVPRDFSNLRGVDANEFYGTGVRVSFFPLSGYNGIDSQSYIVTVGGITQSASDYTISEANRGTITFPTAPPARAKISVRTLTGAPGGGSASFLQSRSISNNSAQNRQVLKWNSATSEWVPRNQTTSVPYNSGGSTTVNSVTSFNFIIPSGVRWLRLNGDTGVGAAGEPGHNGENGLDGYTDPESSLPTDGSDGANGANGANGDPGKSVIVGQYTFPGGTGGLGGFGGGGGGGGGIYNGRPGLAGNGEGLGGLGGAGQTDPYVTPNATPDTGNGLGGTGGTGGLGCARVNSDVSTGGAGGAGAFYVNDPASGPGGGGGGGGGGAGNAGILVLGLGGAGGSGGSGTAGGPRLNYDTGINVEGLSSIPVQITTGNGSATLTISW